MVWVSPRDSLCNVCQRQPRPPKPLQSSATAVCMFLFLALHVQATHVLQAPPYSHAALVPFFVAGADKHVFEYLRALTALHKATGPPAACTWCAFVTEAVYFTRIAKSINVRVLPPWSSEAKWPRPHPCDSVDYRQERERHRGWLAHRLRDPWIVIDDDTLPKVAFTWKMTMRNDTLSSACSFCSR